MDGLYVLGNVLAFKIVENPDKVGIGRKSIFKCFGKTSIFSSTLTILEVGQDITTLKMETCAGIDLYYLL